MTNFKEFNHVKIWLTIRVIDTKNNSFILINNLPFNTDDYKDISMVIWDNYKDYFLMNSENRLESINFSYHQFDDKKNYQYKINLKWIMFLYRLFFVIFFIMIICILFIYILDYYEYDILLVKRDIPDVDENIRLEPHVYSSNLYYAKTNGFYNSLTHHNSIFTLFIDLFNKTGTTYYNYFPSYFIPTSFNTPTVHISSIDIIVDNQYKILYNNTENLHKLFLDLAHILHEYKQIVQYINI